MGTTTAFTHEMQQLPDDQFGNKVTKVTCHGKLTAANVGELNALVKPLILIGGRIVVDLGDVNFVDSSGLAAFIALKVSAIKQALCILEFVNMTAPILKLLHMTKLEKLLTP
jgi:anti-anti-sigma factor